VTKLNQLAEVGQAVWLDYIQRAFMKSGELQKLINMGLRGMTSNPTIFEKAIAGSPDYDEEIAPLARQGKSTQEIYETLAIADIRMSADLLRPVYDATRGADGYVSLEVNPELAHDTAQTLSEAKRLWAEVQRPNLMVKIPATREGIPAIREAIAAGVNVNVTLIFSLERYEEVMEAYLKGLEKRLKHGESVEQIASVASFFVSRLDSKVDKRLEVVIKDGGPQAKQAAPLLGRSAVANAKLAYQRFKRVFEGERFQKLAAHGARLQRPLWASTSTKNPNYSDILYVQELIGKHTVNTLPQNTLEAFLDHGHVKLTIEEGVEQSRNEIAALERLGISMESVTQELEDEGVTAFAKSYQDLLKSLEEKRLSLARRQPPFDAALGAYRVAVEKALDRMDQENIIARIWKQDHTVWKPDPKEIINRLGWLHIAEDMEIHMRQMEALAYAALQAGYQQVVLLGMGGSSLAPELFARTFGSAAGYPTLRVMDSTDPQAVNALESELDYAQTLFIVSTKSGGTEETLSFFKYFYYRAIAEVGRREAGEHFIAITDPGSKLIELAKSLDFRSIFLNNPNIGGRYSALSYFGLVPAALIGVDLQRLLDKAHQVAAECKPPRALDENPAAWLGATIGTLANQGRDKLTFILSPQLASFGDWVEQLIAESTGKEGKGILPVVGEYLGEPAAFSSDRLFVSIQMAGDESNAPILGKIESAGHPLLRLEVKDVYDLGGQFLLWELATAIAGYFLGINPFDQPNVESAKQRARQMVAAYKAEASLPEMLPLLQADGITVFGDLKSTSLKSALADFLNQARSGDYITLQAFLQPQAETSAALQELRRKLLLRTHLATTLGYGPRFLHSTGQLHKGDGGNGLFIQFTARGAADIPIPDQAGSPESSMTFGVLKMAQALGDQLALKDAGRRVVRFHLEGDEASAIHQLSSLLG
jgi:transaldolase/glucose-6-phosphate isomerase